MKPPRLGTKMRGSDNRRTERFQAAIMHAYRVLKNQSFKKFVSRRRLAQSMFQLVRCHLHAMHAYWRPILHVWLSPALPPSLPCRHHTQDILDTLLDVLRDPWCWRTRIGCHAQVDPPAEIKVPGFRGRLLQRSNFWFEKGVDWLKVDYGGIYSESVFNS